jgi:hypothetical protein
VAGKGPALLVEICKHLNADRYLSGGFGREYLDAGQFSNAGIELAFHDYEYPVYPQSHEPFVPFLSYLDVLFNGGLQREMVMSGDKTTRAAKEMIRS